MALNATQRKYAVERLTNIYTQKMVDLKGAFEALPENKLKPMVYTSQADYVQVLKALVGLPSTAVLLPNYLELVSRSGSHTGIQSLAELQNREAINEIAAYNAAITARHKINVADKVILLSAKLTECKDMLYLGDADEALSAIADFTAYTV